MKMTANAKQFLKDNDYFCFLVAGHGIDKIVSNRVLQFVRNLSWSGKPILDDWYNVAVVENLKIELPKHMPQFKNHPLWADAYIDPDFLEKDLKEPSTKIFDCSKCKHYHMCQADPKAVVSWDEK